MDKPYTIDLQVECQSEIPLSTSKLFDWIYLALKEHIDRAEMTLRLVEPEEMTELNTTYRQQHKPTNVLAFPSTLPDYVSLEYPYLGDIIICPKILEQESQDSHTPLEAHWAHIVIHGVLHLLGYD